MLFLPIREPFEQIDDEVFLFPQKPHHRSAVETIADEEVLTESDIFRRGLLLWNRVGQFGVSDGVIFILGIDPKRGCAVVSGDDGPVTRISSVVRFLRGRDAQILRQLLHEFQEAIS